MFHLKPYHELPLDAPLYFLSILLQGLGNPLIRIIRYALVFGVLFLTIVTGVTKAKKEYTNGWSLMPGDLQLLTILAHGTEGSRAQQGVRPVQLPGYGLFVYTGNDQLPFWPVVYHAPNPKEVFPLYTTLQSGEPEGACQ